MRVLKSKYTLPEAQYQPVVYLSDGAFVSVGERGRVMIFNADGTLRSQQNLVGPPYKTPSVVAANDIIYISGETKHVYALNSDGSTLWHFSDTNGAKILAGMAIGPDGTVYFADDRGVVYALNGSNGQKLWQFVAIGAGPVLAALKVGPDGTLYFASEKGFVYALGPDGRQKWLYKTNLQVLLSPILDQSGLVYVVSTEGKKVFALEQASGVLRFSFSANSKIIALPVVGADGSLYIPAEDRSLYALNPGGSQRFVFRPS
ncbi:MAG: hypothetical protein A2Z49_09490, partial [Chloroflexi bacterium RBG_19FT_COMBO_56_12]